MANICIVGAIVLTLSMSLNVIYRKLMHVFRCVHLLKNAQSKDVKQILDVYRTEFKQSVITAF